MNKTKVASELLKLAKNLSSAASDDLKEPLIDISKTLLSCDERVKRMAARAKPEDDSMTVHEVVSELHATQAALNRIITVLMRRVSK